MERHSQQMTIEQFRHRPRHIVEHINHFEVRERWHITIYGVEAEYLKIPVINVFEFEQLQTSAMFIRYDNGPVERHLNPMLSNTEVCRRIGINV